MDDDSLMNEPVIRVLNALRRAARMMEGVNQDKNESSYPLMLLNRTRPFLQSLGSDPRVKNMLQSMGTGDSVLNILDVLSKTLKSKEGIEVTTLTEPDDIHVERLTMAEILGLSLGSCSGTVVHTNTDLYFSRYRRQAGTPFGSAMDRIAEDAAFFLRKTLAHCLDFNLHVKPIMEKLQDPYLNTGMEQVSKAITTYARFGGAAHTVLEAHPGASMKFEEDLKQILSKIEKPLQPKGLHPLHQISRELRQNVPFLAMPQDIFGEYGKELRRKHEHLRVVYRNVHITLCELGFAVETDPEETILPPTEMPDLLDILGSDTELASLMAHSLHARRFRDWTMRVRKAVKDIDPVLESIETVGEIVSVLQEMCDMFPNIDRGNRVLLAELQRKLMDHIEREFPRMAEQHASQLMTSGGKFVLDDETLGILAPLLDSPSAKCQENGIHALALYLEPFAMGHYKKHEQLKGKKKEEHKQQQRSRLGEAFRSCMLPYHRPELELEFMPSENVREEGLSMSHLGPLPTYKGCFVQRHVDRGPVHGGSLTGVYPLVVMVGPSGVGELINNFNILLYVLLQVCYINSLLLRED